MIILSVDHGMKNIGVAVCDELMIAARAVQSIPHKSKGADAKAIIEIANHLNANRIIVGVSYNEEGEPNEAGIRALNFIEIIQSITTLEVLPWDESLTTADAKSLRLETGRSKKARLGHHDALAASILLQSYIDQLEQNL